MEPIYYLPSSDLALSFLIKKAKAVLNEELYAAEANNINAIVSAFNILRYLDEGHGKLLGNPDGDKLKAFIFTFLKNNHPVDILSCFDDLNVRLKDDFWDFFASYNLHKKVDDENFTKFLEEIKPSIYPLLCLPAIQKSYKEPLRKYFLSDVDNTNFILDKNEKNHTHLGKKQPQIPYSITKDEELNLISEYINSPNAAPGHLMVISKIKDLSARKKLAAKKREQEVSEKILSQGTLMKFGIELSYTEQAEPVKIAYDSGITKYEYDISWIRNNIDEATLLNNFIYLFDFVDGRTGITLCYQKSESGLMEQLTGIDRKDWHPDSIAFSQKNHAAILQLHSYNNILEELGTSIEYLLNWFFRDYLKDEFGIENFQADLPVGGSNYYDKCRIITPEIERILKQFECFIDEGEINHELIAIDTNPFPVSKCRSLLDKKYCYINSEDLNIATHYLFSDQSMLNYNSKTDTSYNSLFDRACQEKLHKSDFEDYQKRDLEWLIVNGYFEYDDDENLIILNKSAIAFLNEIHKTGCLNYDLYRGIHKSALDTMLDSGKLTPESSLFSRPERDFIDYHLNKQQFINSLDLRNKYAHGSHSGATEGEHEHFLNYFQLLKIVVCIVLKINDEFCTKCPDNN